MVEFYDLIKKYYDVIMSELDKYNSVHSGNSMGVYLFKGNEEVKSRLCHEYYVQAFASSFSSMLGTSTNKWVAGLIGRFHDIGHCFFSHAGESILNDILREEEMGYFSHTFIGVWKLIYLYDIESKITCGIKNKGCSASDLEIIKNNLWRIFDGIYAHGSFKKEAVASFNGDKTREDFEKDILNGIMYGDCREVTPSLKEGALVRQLDMVAYSIVDLVDALSCHIISYDDILNDRNIRDKFNGISKSHDIFAYLRDYFILDLVNNSRDSNIIMSEDACDFLHNLNKFNANNIYSKISFSHESMDDVRDWIRFLVITSSLDKRDDFKGFEKSISRLGLNIVTKGNDEVIDKWIRILFLSNFNDDAMFNLLRSYFGARVDLMIDREKNKKDKSSLDYYNNDPKKNSLKK